MKFHDYETMFIQARRESPAFASCKATEFYKVFADDLKKNPHFGMGTRMIELNWYADNRPYYKVWPSIVNALLRTKLDIPFSAIIADAKEKTLAIRLPVGICVHGMPQATAGLVQWHPFAANDREKSGLGFILCAQRERGLFSSIYVPHGALEDSIESLESYHMDDGDGDAIRDSTDRDHDSMRCRFGFMRLAIAIRLLEQDPTIIQPDVLANDRDRFDRSTDLEERQHLIDKAKRKGIVGWRIGEQYEVCPHFRRPHFALRHTGPRGNIPRIVPVRGAIVHRKKVTDVPTGYMTESGVEIENVANDER